MLGRPLSWSTLRPTCLVKHTFNTMNPDSNGSCSENLVTIEEGKAKIQQPKSVFYNKVQTFNRDISVLAIRTFIKNKLWTCSKHAHLIKEIKILDALSATGLRAVRYAKELEASERGIQIVANDILVKASNAIKKNCELNQVSHLVTVKNEDAAMLMYANRKIKDRFLVVDVDPYGSCADFIDSAVQSVADGGLLMVTCTDMAILCGNHSETAFAKYGGSSLRLVSCHEQALRLVLRSIEATATKYGRCIKPLLSLSVDFYIRMFIQVHTSPLNAKRSASRSGIVYLCKGCHSFNIQPFGTFQKLDDNVNGKCEYNVATGPVVDSTCQHCDSKFTVGGPIFIDSIHDGNFVELMKSELEASGDEFATARRMAGMLQVVSEELPDSPLFWTLDELCRIAKSASPGMNVIRSAIMNAGFKVSYSHANSASLKTNAPHDFIWDFMRKWVQLHPPKETAPPDTMSATQRLLAKTVKHQIDMTIRDDVVPLSKRLDLLRFQPNPEPNWGPKPRPDNKRGHDTLASNLKGKKCKVITEND